MYKMYDTQWDDDGDKNSLSSSFWSDGEHQKEEEEEEVLVERVIGEEDLKLVGDAEQSRREASEEEKPELNKQLSFIGSESEIMERGGHDDKKNERGGEENKGEAEGRGEQDDGKGAAEGNEVEGVTEEDDSEGENDDEEDNEGEDDDEEEEDEREDEEVESIEDDDEEEEEEDEGEDEEVENAAVEEDEEDEEEEEDEGEDEDVENAAEEEDDEDEEEDENAVVEEEEEGEENDEAGVEEDDEEGDEEEESCSSSCESPAPSLMTSGYGTYRPEEQDGGEYRDNHTITEFDQDSRGDLSETRDDEDNEEDSRSLCSFGGFDIEPTDPDYGESQASSMLADVEPEANVKHFGDDEDVNVTERKLEEDEDQAYEEEDLHTFKNEATLSEEHHIAAVEDKFVLDGKHLEGGHVDAEGGKQGEQPEEEVQDLKEENNVEEEAQVESEDPDEASSNKDIKFIDSKADLSWMMYDKMCEEWEGNLRQTKGK